MESTALAFGKLLRVVVILWFWPSKISSPPMTKFNIFHLFSSVSVRHGRLLKTAHPNPGVFNFYTWLDSVSDRQ